MTDPIYKTDALIAEDIEAYLDQHQNKSMLRFITCGSVDDGKSTLIGRLLYDTQQVFEDLRRGLRHRTPLLAQIGGTNGTLRLGPTRKQAGRGQRAAETLGATPPLSCLHPTAEANSRCCNRDLRRIVDDARRHALQLGIVGERNDSNRRGVHHRRAAPNQ